MGENESASSFDLQKILEDIVSEIPEETSRPEQCIYKAPAAIRKLNEAAYTPQVISIGPFHHGSENLKPMEIQKKMYLKEFCKRLRWLTQEQEHESLKELLSIIKDREDDIKRRYAASSFEISSDQFVKMILLDAVFIFELFLKNKEYSVNRTMYQYDFFIGVPISRAAIQRDLILLENQLPFFILEELYNHATGYCKATYDSPFLDLSCHYFENYSKNKTMQFKPLHFTDLVRWFLFFRHPTLKPPEGKQIKNPYSATMLHQAGLKFKADLRAECLLDIRAWDENVNPPIKKGELHMPQLKIDNCTECLFRNLMALEHCLYPREEVICCYVKLLNFLVVVEKDVDLLIENKVIVSTHGDSKAVASLVKTLCLEIEVTSGYDALSDLLNNYYDSSWKKYLVHFQNVRSGTGTVIGLTSLFARCAGFFFI